MKSTTATLASALLVVNTFIVMLLPALANEKSDKALADNIYGAGKATLVWPGDETAATSTPYSDDYATSLRYGSRFTGTVERVRANDYFDLRASDGRTYRVIGSDNNDRFDVGYGQRVEVQGSLSQDIIIATRVRRDGGGGSQNWRVDFPATVYSVSGFNRLTVRASNGGRYTIESRYRLPQSLSYGDFVRIVGTWNGTVVNAEQITVLRDDSGYGSRDRNVDFPGIVTFVDNTRNALSLRGDNGITYTVSYNNADKFTQNERVRVIGSFDGYTVRATSVSRR